MGIYLGLMSGTSLDGIDAAAVQWPDDGAAPLRVLGHEHRGFASGLRAELLALNTPGANELDRAARAAIALARAYADAIDSLLAHSGLRAAQVRAIGAHGQTVRHRPDAVAGGYSIQLLDGAVLAERCAIDVVCNLRGRDLAAGGQGAPLVPAFHADRFGAPGEDRAVLNLGGIANLTLLGRDGGVGGFDCGPGNVLIDLWIARQRALAHDEGGAWAASGRVDAALLAQLMTEPYLARPLPKSTGRDLFDAAWLDAQLATAPAALQPVDVQATLAEFTVQVVAQSLGRHLPRAARLVVCGGGAYNRHLLSRLRALLPTLTVQTSDELGLPAQQVEAVAFAWLAREFVARRPANRPEVTGAAGPRRLGCLYPAG